jgi:hypothetical protein
VPGDQGDQQGREVLPVIALAPVSAQLFGDHDIVRNAGLIFVATLLGASTARNVPAPSTSCPGTRAISRVVRQMPARATWVVSAG